ncbi:MAG TPA: hypothetical protein VGR96_15840 [Acidobacteriaceae bacterium]|nr:hypothetical protein [Acidobacteriaceae bacterium]
MAISRQWTEWHLTPGGWISGSTRRDGEGNVWRDEPEDRVVTFVYREQTGSSSVQPQITVEESWRSKIHKNIDSLLAQHGPCPRKLL